MPVKIAKTRKPKAPRLIVYGPAGCYKSTFADAIEGRFILDTEGGSPAEIGYNEEVPETWQNIVEYIDYIADADHGYKYFVIDTLDWLLRRLTEHVQGNNVNTTLNKAHGGYGNGKQVLVNHVYQTLLPKLNKIRERGIGIVLICHQLTTVLKDADGCDVEKLAPDAGVFTKIFTEWVDAVGIVKVNQEGKAFIAFNDTELYTAKNRYRIGNPLAFDWPTVSAAINPKTKPETITKQENK